MMMPRRTLNASGIATIALLAGALALTGCSDSLLGGGDSPAVHPTFILRADGHAAHQSWDPSTVFTVSALPRDSATPFPLDVRVPATVTTSAGDAERLYLSRRFCSGTTFCHTLSISFTAEADVNGIAGDLDRLGARFTMVNARYTSAQLFVLEPNDIPRIAFRLNSRHGVPSVGRSGLAVAGWGPDTMTLYAGITGGVRMAERTGTVTRHNRYLEIVSGDTITVAIAQPDGSDHVVNIVVPE